MVTCRLQAERRTGSVHRPKTGVPPTVLATKMCYDVKRKETESRDTNDMNQKVNSRDKVCASVRRRSYVVDGGLNSQ